MFYKYIDTPVGPFLVAGDGASLSVASFAAGHQHRRPQADWKEDASAMRFAIEQIEQYFAGERKVFDMPLVMHGTPFQKQVWDVLLTIPFGETRTYGDVSRAIGRGPGASRAVGAANGANHIPIVIPCHRVIGGDGTLTGFGGGLDAKQWLLEFEGITMPESVHQSSLF
jgi:methylated-DNA-[protein]-cysteine S-methyltransferase